MNEAARVKILNGIMFFPITFNVLLSRPKGSTVQPRVEVPEKVIITHLKSQTFRLDSIENKTIFIPYTEVGKSVSC